MPAGARIRRITDSDGEHRETAAAAFVVEQDHVFGAGVEDIIDGVGSLIDALW